MFNYYPKYLRITVNLRTYDKLKLSIDSEARRAFGASLRTGEHGRTKIPPVFLSFAAVLRSGRFFHFLAGFDNDDGLVCKA